MSVSRQRTCLRCLGGCRPEAVPFASCPSSACLTGSRETRQCPFQGNGRVYVVSEAAALRQFLCFLPVLGGWQGSLHADQRHRRVNRDRSTTCLGPFSAFQRFPRDETRACFSNIASSSETSSATQSVDPRDEQEKAGLASRNEIGALARLKG